VFPGRGGAGDEAARVALARLGLRAHVQGVEQEGVDMELHVHHAEIGPMTTADLIAGPFTPGAQFPVIMPDNRRFRGSVVAIENDAVTIDIKGVIWFLRRHNVVDINVRTKTTLPIERWIFSGRA
jgi:hypothetical protein